MNNLYRILVGCLCLTLLFTSCKDDQDGIIELRYDENNFSAPELPSATYEAGTMFPASFSGNDAGNELIAVEYFIQALPTSASLKIYTGGTDAPDSLIYSAAILSEIDNNSWNTHNLPTAIELTGSDNIWINIEFTQNGLQRTLGCDPGPASTNGDWLYDSNDGLWIPLVDRSTIDINWNIRGQVQLPETE